MAVLSLSPLHDNELFCLTKFFELLPPYAVLFFSISCFNELLCVLLYTFVFPTLPIVKFYRSKAASEGSKTVAGDLAAAGVPTQHDEQVRLVLMVTYS